MTQEELLDADNAQVIAEQQAEGILAFTEQLVVQAANDLKVLEPAYEATVPITLAKKEALDIAIWTTQTAAEAHDSAWVPPFFDASTITEIPADTFYGVLSTEIDAQLIALAEYDTAKANEDYAKKELDDRQAEFDSAFAQKEIAKQLIANLNTIEESIDAEQAVQDAAQLEADKLAAELAELARLDELRRKEKFSLNKTKEQFYFKFDVESSERFVMEKFLEEDEDFFDLYNSNMWTSVKDLERYGEFIVTNEAQRIDLISYNIYGTTQYWWMLLEYNDIVDQFSIKTGDIIAFFKLDDLEKKYHSLQKEQHKKGKKEE